MGGKESIGKMTATCKITLAALSDIMGFTTSQIVGISASDENGICEITIEGPDVPENTETVSLTYERVTGISGTSIIKGPEIRAFTATHYLTTALPKPPPVNLWIVTEKS
jgi:hypothetical protein